VYRATAGLVPYANNARTHCEGQIAQIAGSIREFGFVNPVLIDEAGGIVAGHGRVLAARLLGMEEVPTITLAHLTPNQRKAFVIADNKLALNAGWDEELLRLELETLTEEGYDVGLLGFTDSELEALLTGEGRGLTDPDDLPTPGVPVVKPGDLWLLGAHRLVCGSALDAADWHALMQGERGDLVVTDPPYNVGYVGGTKDALTLQNDSMKGADYLEFLSTALERCFACMRKGAVIYLAHADTDAGVPVRAAFNHAGFKFSGCLIWQKDALVLGRSDWQWQHEPILYGWKPGKAHYWRGGRKRTTVLQFGDDRVLRPTDDGRFAIQVGDDVIVVGPAAEIEMRAGSLLRVDRPRRSSEHPTMKPVALWEKLMRPSSRSGDIVIDPFAGSGTTLIAAELQGLRARVIELEPAYCDVCLRRWAAFTGQQPTLDADGRRFEEIEHGSARTSADADSAAPGARQSG
jgi:DNA modification methylase